MPIELAGHRRPVHRALDHLVVVGDLFAVNGLGEVLLLVESAESSTSANVDGGRQGDALLQLVERILHRLLLGEDERLNRPLDVLRALELLLLALADLLGEHPDLFEIVAEEADELELAGLVLLGLLARGGGGGPRLRE